MHEMSLISRVVDIVLEECAKTNASKVLSVHLVIGEMHDVVEEYIPGLFEFLARDTVAEHANITITRIPITAICNECGFVLLPDVDDPSSLECPQCHAYRNYRLYTGREFLIENIEIEQAPITEERV